MLNIKIHPELVDVNVHPRKEEVRFQNPYRVFSAVENAVKHVLEKELSFRSKEAGSFEEMRNRFKKEDTPKSDSSTGGLFSSTNTGKSYVPSQPSFNNNQNNSVKDSLDFSRELLGGNDRETSNLPVGNSKTGYEPKEEVLDGSIRNLFQIFNKYIVIEFEEGILWVVDQHAAAERINFEKLQDTHSKQDAQNLLVPNEIEMTKEETLFVMEFKDFFAELGFELSEFEKGIKIHSTPAEFANSDFMAMFKEIFEIEEDIEILKKNFTKLRDDVLATMSCHTSIRAGQALSKPEMYSLYNQLKECNNPYSCPHGRPAIWKMSINEIDSNFERTY